MVGSEYTVASAEKLVGSLISKRLELQRSEDQQEATSKRTDEEERPLKRKKTVRFASDALASRDGANTAHMGGLKLLRSSDAEFAETRGNEIDASRKLPYHHQSRINQTKATLGTYQATPTIHRFEHGRKDLQVCIPEIYFSPNDIGISSADLSSPYVGVTKRAVRDEEDLETPKTTACIALGVDGLGHGQDQYTFTEVQVDQLVAELVKSLLVQRHVRKQWWDWEDTLDNATISDMSSVYTPTLTSASTLYSLPNEGFLNKSISPPQVYQLFQKPPQRRFPDPQLSTSHAKPNAEYSGVIFCDPKIHGCPIRYASKDYRLGANTLTVGHCSFLNIPHGPSTECVLRIEPPSQSSPRCRVILQAVNQMVDRKTKAKCDLLTFEFDLTTSFVEAALVELAAEVGTTLDRLNIVSSPSAEPRESDKPEEQVDWSALADELQSVSDLADAMDNAMAAFSRLTEDTCSAQTLDVLALLDHAKDQHADFLVLRPRGFHANGLPTSIGIPWMSQRLFHAWYEDMRCAQDADTARDFRISLVAEVAKHAKAKEEVLTSLPWGEVRQRVVECVPLFGGREGRAEAWVCILKGEF